MPLNLDPWLKQLSLTDKRSRHVLLDPNWTPLQRRITDEVQNAYNEGRPARLITLKSRQLGCSTISGGIGFSWTTMFPNTLAFVVAHTSQSTLYLFDKMRYFYENWPHRRSYPTRFSSRREIMFSNNNSSIRVQTARNPDALRGRTINFAHLCLDANTPVIVENGSVLPISDVTVGTKVLTHTGQPATVTAVSSYEAPPCIRLTPWLGDGVVLTPNHKVWTRKGWARADSLRKDDEVFMPVRPITSGQEGLTLKDTEARLKVGKHRKFVGDVIPLNEETGFAFGYYLAEGSMVYNADKGAGRRPAGITLSRHRDETAYGDRAVKALAPWITSHRRTDRMYALTSVETLYGAALAETIRDTFGEKAEKRVPDWVFQAGEEFCLGLLAGYLSGDGSKSFVISQSELRQEGKKYQTPQVTATSIRSSLVVQMRDIAASLGIGWGRVSEKPGGVRYGRNCKDAWNVSWHGRAARVLRGMMEMESDPVTRREWVEKYRLEEDGVWIRIRKVEPAESERVYDLAVDHPDHSFRTLHFAVSNSEIAFWEKQEENMVAIRTAVPQAPGTVIIIESTPNGIGGWFYDTWNEASGGRNDYVPIFAPWFTHHEYIPCYGFKCRDGTCETCVDQSRIRPEGEEEKELIRLGCDLPHLAWRRWALPNVAFGSLDWFNQEFPKDPETCFLTSGVMVFPHVYLDRVYERVRPAIGRLGKEGFTVDSTGPLRVFKPPSSDIEWGRYFIGADVGFGVQDGDYSAAQVINRQTKEQVAVWHGRINPYAFADELMKLGRYYNNAVIACESDGPGMGTIGKMVGVYPNLWHSRLMDRVPGRQRSDVQIGFSNNWKRKQWLVTQLADAVERGDVTLHDRQTYDELKAYSFYGDKGDTFGPAGDGHDDLVMSLGIAVLCERLESPVPPYETRPGPRGKDSKVVFGESVDLGQMIWGEDEATA